MTAAASDVGAEYQGYLERFEGTIGPCEVGAYAKHHGRLIKKLRVEEFTAKWEEFVEAQRTYKEIEERGDTMNDVLVRILRERCDELLLERVV